MLGGQRGGHLGGLLQTSPTLRWPFIPSACMAATHEKLVARSVPQRFSTSKKPEVNTWVQVLTENDKKKRRWDKAVPALVSKVSTVLGDSNPEVHVNVLLPNALALQYKFQAERYREVKGLMLDQMRPYLGDDRSKLKLALLLAFKEKARERMPDRGAQVIAPAQTVQPRQGMQAETVSSSKRKFAREDMDTTRENITKFFKKYSAPTSASTSLCQGGPESVQPLMDQLTASSSSSGSQEHVPQTPEACSSRILERKITPLKPEIPRVTGVKENTTEKVDFIHQKPSESSETKPLSSPRRLTSKQRLAQEVNPAPAPAQAVLSKKRFDNLTVLISKAFRTSSDAQGEGILSKQAIADIMESKGIGLAEGELDETLKRLDAANKVMLSDDLVFIV